jgi:hypothetical protein
MAIEIVDLHIKNGDCPHFFYVCQKVTNLNTLHGHIMFAEIYDRMFGDFAFVSECQIRNA